MNKKKLTINGPVLLFDGDCAMCNRSIQFILNHIDSKSNLSFMPLQNVDLSAYKIESIDSLIYIDQSMNILAYYSSAVIHVAIHLNQPYKFGRILLWLIPKIIRDQGYKIIAKNRTRLFKKQVCLLIPEEHKHRLLA